MTFEEALQLIEATLEAKTAKQLTPPEKEILKAAWENDTYTNVAESLYLSTGHIKDLASLLWQRLSDAFEEKVTKNNLRRLLENRNATSPMAFEKIESSDIDKSEAPKGNILIVDDLAENLQLLTDILTKRGYKVRSVTNGKMALRTVRNNRPDVILLDIKMPEMDGYQVCSALKADEETEEIPVIFLSSLNQTNDKVKAFQIGGVDYITKPFQSEEVISRIQTQLTIQQQKHQLRQEIERHQQTAEILYQSRALLANLLNSSPDGIAAMQAVRDIITGEINEFRCLVVNTVIAKLLGKKREDLMGQSSIKKQLNQLIPELFDSLVQVVETGELFEQEFCWGKDDFQKWYNFQAVKFGDGVSITVRELTNVKPVEFKLKLPESFNRSHTA
ncbi:MAG TPA: response regulator [Cyanobacteria bacterium UBA11369]|nr:response regulator [Cyanobacteria bacterium UBA11371]HBE35917.1 response regulator [Cyanobacteria bacterium UBA11368]HBE52406.1 response regulator [Cyanobacteria bacterium UBA11369]